MAVIHFKRSILQELDAFVFVNPELMCLYDCRLIIELF